ncbi:MAG: (Fe-S)-binding protein [Proteobacteria bacterium]|nr:(Fe-S)-binding protein [Pseudomonadota bacterium]MBU1584917.1 (Fe-S)-binding protein [Pseudomonadota bacterium]MBU2456270.1 (Fe-S)-binding protein [Pseudomonadota bacterium]MBU2630457.1 (Fe-S)-binding protein [Pseudomonadota bacterium]
MDKTQPVTLFIQCLIDGMYPEIGEAVVRLFEKLKIPVDCPLDQTCCGQVAYNSGYQKEARMAAKRFIQLFEKAAVIVCPSGSCVDMVRHNYPALFKDDFPWFKRALSISSKTFELTEYLVDILGIEDIGACFDKKITYHDSCHLLRNLDIAEQPRKLIQHVKGATFIEMKNSDKCCGFGGTFSVKYPDISTAILEEKVDNIIESGADTVVGCDISCLMNIQGMLSRKNVSIKTLHIAQLLAGQ